ncbi:MAG: aminotransferase class I/II-fold pyridoxal phosphate-dependent enzyme [Bacteroidia bacterium]|nr:aminotransferase class I/II-fold pyridoxal phosphate-dependent enzyme [Bacteroidia bacterium]MCZ2249358.1 aminotransferase class I/II-fold pyridoxal phosphate-dependent enzyme [Bacteroidia bacterium]
MITTEKKVQISKKAENMIGSEIIKIAADINEKIKQGNKIYNLTIGDFNSNIYPIPELLKEHITQAYRNNETNYPAAPGMLELREAVSTYLKHYGNLEYTAQQIMIAGGARPLIYAAFQTLVNPNEQVIFPVPSWNNNHYCYLSDAQQIIIPTQPENHFMPTAAEIAPHIENAALIALCSPLNPTGTVLSKESLNDICNLILKENERRGPSQKPLYLLYDQIYWMLTHGETRHYDPASLNPEMKKYTIYIDGISKAFAATGVRVGWAFGPKIIIDKMVAILTHIGAWAPKAEQLAVANFLADNNAVDTYLTHHKSKLYEALNLLYQGFEELEKEGIPVKAIKPQAAMYLTVQFNLLGYVTPEGKTLSNVLEITSYLLNHANLGIVPFSAFGTGTDSTWFRISVGTCHSEDIPQIIQQIKLAISKLKA